MPAPASPLITQPLSSGNTRQANIGYMPASTGDFVRATAADAWSNNPLPRLRDIEAAVSERMVGNPFDTTLSPEEANAKYGHMGLTFDSPVTAGYAEMRAQQKADELYNKSIMQRYQGGTALGLAVGLGTSVVDPINVGSAFIPVVGEARYAQLLARFGRFGGRAITGVAEGAVGAAMIEPLVVGGAAAAQYDGYGLDDSMWNITFGGILGGGLHAGAGFLPGARARDFAAIVQETRTDVGAANAGTQPPPAQAAPGQAVTPAQPAAAPTLTPLDRDIAIRTMWAEARGEAPDGEAAVANVLLNRLNRGTYGKNLVEVAKAKNQFEPWGNAQTRAKMEALSPNDPEYQRLGQIFDQVAKGELTDNTGGAENFWSPTAQAALGRKPPKWASRMRETAKIGKHVFYANGEAGARGKFDVAAGDTGASIATNEIADRATLARQIDELPQEARAAITTQAIDQISAGRSPDVGDALKSAGIKNTAPITNSRVAAMREGLALKKELGFKPVDLLEAMRDAGGLDNTGLSAMEKANVRAAGSKLSKYGREFGDIWDGNPNLKKRIYRSGGLPPDEMAMLMEEAGYIPKGSGPEGLREAVKRAAGGEKIYNLDSLKPEYRERLEAYTMRQKEQRYQDSLPPEDYTASMDAMYDRPPMIEEVIAQMPEGDLKSAYGEMARQGYNFSDDEIMSIFAEVDAARQVDVVRLPDSVDGDITAQVSDMDFIDRFAEGDRELEELLTDDMDRLRGLGELTDEERAYLAEADNAAKQVNNMEAAIRAGAGCILKG